MVRLPDVYENFPRVEKIIHRHSIEARLEFIEKEQLDKQQKDLDKAAGEAGPEEKETMPARFKKVRSRMISIQPSRGITSSVAAKTSRSKPTRTAARTSPAETPAGR